LDWMHVPQAVDRAMVHEPPAPPLEEHGLLPPVPPDELVVLPEVLLVLEPEVLVLVVPETPQTLWQFASRQVPSAFAAESAASKVTMHASAWVVMPAVCASHAQVWAAG
jgi:hypothetical protein